MKHSPHIHSYKTNTCRVELYIFLKIYVLIAKLAKKLKEKGKQKSGNQMFDVSLPFYSLYICGVQRTWIFFVDTCGLWMKTIQPFNGRQRDEEMDVDTFPFLRMTAICILV